MMTDKLKQLILDISYGTYQSKDNSNIGLVELVKIYLNDLNSSTMREMVMVHNAGLVHNTAKLGADTLDSDQEMKPKNIISNTANKLSIAGNFSDMTFNRHNKFVSQNLIVHSGGFVDGVLVYQISFSYAELVNHFESQLFRHFPNGDQKGRYLRSLTFGLKQVKDLQSVKVISINDNLEKYRGNIRPSTYTYLKSLK